MRAFQPEEKYPQFKNVESPSQKVGSDITETSKKKKHRIPMKSLMNSYSKEEIFVLITDGRISVTDKGVGIGKKDVSQVTKKFYRSGTHSWDNSMGLGLSIVKTILTMHQSELEISSELDVGSTFSFVLPSSDREKV